MKNVTPSKKAYLNSVSSIFQINTIEIPIKQMLMTKNPNKLNPGNNPGKLSGMIKFSKIDEMILIPPSKLV